MAQFVANDISKKYGDSTRALQIRVAKAATGAMREARAIVIREGKAAIAAAGFSRRWQNILKGAIKPKDAPLQTEVTFFDRSFFLTTFGEGATHTGKPFMWLPLDTVPMGSGHQRLTPAEYKARLGQPLFSARNAKGQPILLGKATSGAILRATPKRISFRKRKKGGIASAFRGPNVPLYVGVSIIRIGKKFDISSIIKRVAGRIGELYVKQIKKQLEDGGPAKL